MRLREGDDSQLQNDDEDASLPAWWKLLWAGGANYFFYGHKLKLQSGLQYADMDDRAGDGGAYSGVSWTTGLRVGW
jgi:hypothetical protein